MTLKSQMFMPVSFMALQWIKAPLWGQEFMYDSLRHQILKVNTPHIRVNENRQKWPNGKVVNTPTCHLFAIYKHENMFYQAEILMNTSRQLYIVTMLLMMYFYTMRVKQSNSKKYINFRSIIYNIRSDLRNIDLLTICSVLV